MKVGKSVTKCIDEFEAGDLESAMLHACNAVDGTARKVYPDLGNKARFTMLLRGCYSILGPMGLPRIDLNATRFPVRINGPTASGGQPDLADVIYGIHRCTHGHGDEMPDGFGLIANAAGPPGYTAMLVEKGKVRLSDRILFGMLAVAVLSPANYDQTAGNGYHLTFDQVAYEINDWWGRLADFEKITAPYNVELVNLDFGDWMT